MQVSAAPYYNNQHSVNGNDQIVWGTYHGSTEWTSARDNAIARWNGLDTIKITPDTASIIETVSFTDYYQRDGYNGNYYYSSWTADEISFNSYYFEDMSSCERNHTALHEMGHALNLADNTLMGSVMKQGTTCLSILGKPDVDDYHDRWGY